MWVRRIARQMPWSSRKLRRASDKIQAWLTLVLVMVALTVAPWLAWWAASTTYLAEERASAWENQHHHPVAAVLTQDAPSRVSDGGQAPPALANVSAPAYWTGPDGTVRAGVVLVEAGTRAGSTVTVWVDDRGTLVLPPRHRYPIAGASMAATLVVVAVTAFLGGIRSIVIWRLNRRRLRSWEAEWLIVGPLWSRR